MSGLPPANWPLTTGEMVTPPWYNYLKSADETWRPKTQIITTFASGLVEQVISNDGVSVINASQNSIFPMEDPLPGVRKVLIYQKATTLGNAFTIEAATYVAIGPGGENGIRIASSATTYAFIELVGTSTSQWHVLEVSSTTLVTVVASS